MENINQVLTEISIKEINNAYKAQLFSETLLGYLRDNTDQDGFQEKCETLLLKALVLRVANGLDFKKIGKQSIETVYILLKNSDNLAELFNQENLEEEEKECILYYRIFSSASDSAREKTIIGLLMKLEKLKNFLIFIKNI